MLGGFTNGIEKDKRTFRLVPESTPCCLLIGTGAYFEHNLFSLGNASIRNPSFDLLAKTALYRLGSTFFNFAISAFVFSYSPSKSNAKIRSKGIDPAYFFGTLF